MYVDYINLMYISDDYESSVPWKVRLLLQTGIRLWIARLKLVCIDEHSEETPVIRYAPCENHFVVLISLYLYRWRDKEWASKIYM